jgi:TetR/AcrR family transcriptional repressor of mexJK operon
MDQIIAASGVARATLYANFADKAAILEAVVNAESERIMAVDAEASPIDFPAAFRDFGFRLLAFLCDPEMISFDRLMGSLEGENLSQRYYAAGPGRSRAQLVRLIAQAQSEKHLTGDDPEAAAGDLAGLWQGYFRIDAYRRGHQRLSDAVIRAQVEHGLRQFYRLYGVRQPE